MSRNLPEYVIAHFGGAQTGAQIVNLQPSYSSEELATILNLTKAKLIVVEEPFQQKITFINLTVNNLLITLFNSEKPYFLHLGLVIIKSIFYWKQNPIRGS